MARLIASAAAVAAAGALGGIAPSADASSAPAAVSHAAAALVSPGSGIAARVDTVGALARLVPLDAARVRAVTGPITAGLATLPASSVAGLADGTHALVADSAATPHAVSLTHCTAAQRGAGVCFAAAHTAAQPAAAGLTLDHPRGTASAGSPTTAAVQISGGTLSVLGVRIARLGVLSSSATCSGHGCTGAATASGASLADGTVLVRNGRQGVEVAVDGGAFHPARTARTVRSIRGPHAEVSTHGGGLRVAIPVSPATLLRAAGVHPIPATAAGSRASVVVTVGPDRTGGAQAALRLGLGLDARLVLPLGGPADAVVTVSDSAGGNLAAVQLAYTVAGRPAAGTVPDQTTRYVVT